jgi:hypothetical protein
MFGFSENAVGPGGERDLRLIAADNPAPRRAYAFRRLPPIAGSAGRSDAGVSVLNRYSVVENGYADERT